MDYHNIHIHISMLLTSIVTISLLLLTTLPPSLTQQSPLNISLCSHTPYKCKGLHDMYYPFWGHNRPRYCGGGDQFNLTCDSDQYTTIQMGSEKFKVQWINATTYAMKVVPLEPEVCSKELSFSLSPLFRYNQTVHNITIFYNCPSELPLGGGYNFTCNSDFVYYEDVEDEVLKQHPALQKCGSSIQMPAEAVVKLNNGTGNGVYAQNGYFGKGFQVNYIVSQECIRCLGSNGTCGSNDAHQFACYCQDGSNALDCSVPVPRRQSMSSVPYCLFLNFPVPPFGLRMLYIN